MLVPTAQMLVWLRHSNVVMDSFLHLVRLNASVAIQVICVILLLLLKHIWRVINAQVLNVWCMLYTKLLPAQLDIIVILMNSSLCHARLVLSKTHLSLRPQLAHA